MQSTHASIATSTNVASVSRYGTLQMPSFAFRRSLTACGLALPPDCFITWPTNQPASCGLAFACATLSGLAAMMSSTTFSIAPEIGDLLHAARFDQLARVAAFGPDDLEQVLGDLAGDRALADQADDRSQLRRRHRRVRDVAAFLVEAPEQLVDHPVGGELAVARLVGKTREHGFVEHRALALGHQHAGIVGRQAEAFDEARLLLVRQFRQLRPELIDIALRELERQQVRDPGNSDSRALLPWSASSASRPCRGRTAAFPGRSRRHPR